MRKEANGAVFLDLEMIKNENMNIVGARFSDSRWSFLSQNSLSEVILSKT